MASKAQEEGRTPVSVVIGQGPESVLCQEGEEVLMLAGFRFIVKGGAL